MIKASASPKPSDSDRFTLCLPFILAQEQNVAGPWGNPKNFDNDPHDPGGATQDGITQAEYGNWLHAHGLPEKSVQKITEAEGCAIYRHSYWLPYCPHLPPGLDLQFFDASVNQGGEEATRILQVALGVENDGIWGPQTAHAVQTIKSVAAAIKAFTARREAVYRMTANFKYFGNDWIRRASQIGAEALKMEAA